jgi:hypothetical protein
VPLPALIVLLTAYGVVRIRESGGTGDGYLMAGAGLVLTGVFVTLTILGRDGENEPDKAFWEKVLDRRQGPKGESPVVKEEPEEGPPPPTKGKPKG